LKYFSEKEIKFLHPLEEARIATSHDDIPHVKPVSYIYDQNFILIATDYDTRTYQNILKNPKASVVIDVYIPGNHKAVCIQGDVETIDDGERFQDYYQLFFEKFKWVRDDPWKEKEAPFLKIIPTNITSWGIN
jgi:nitroimidazol reductase NimA-like FMN-containing flavoprotein (pyridoxamine 5'-phosphate oxidase superfamily)